jgi:hypothetical protein
MAWLLPFLNLPVSIPGRGRVPSGVLKLWLLFFDQSLIVSLFPGKGRPAMAWPDPLEGV